MKRIFLPLFFLALLASTDLLAQITPRTLPARVEDALRFGNVTPIGSARFAGTGGSMTSIGVDYTTLHTNPAGIGWNRYSSLQVTPGFSLNSLETQLRGGNNAAETETKGSVTVPSLGLVWAGDTRSVNFSTFNWGIGITRIADFNETIAFDGRSVGGVIDAIVEDLNDGIGDPFRTDLIFDIDPSIGPEVRDVAVDDRAVLFDDLGYYSLLDLSENQGVSSRKTGRIERTGGISEFSVGAGGNYREKILWGAAIGIPFVNFSEEKIYDEVDEGDQLLDFDDASFDERLDFSGSGVNFKLGLIGRPTDQLRLSIAVHTPTFWTIDETYETDLEYNYTFAGDALGGNALSPLSQAAINLQTPWRFFFGGGYLIGRSGFISIDADYTNFAGNKFSTADFAELDEAANADVDATLGGSLGLRVGGELNLKPLQIRAGVSYRQLPVLEARYGEDEALLGLSAGLGYSVGKFFIDAAVRYEDSQGYYTPYRTFAFDGQIVDVNRTRISALVTLGVRGF
ncbi:MAG: hypothetical protein AAGF89_09350 [Bacteroidota bacterium]